MKYYRGRLLITDEAVEVLKGINFFRASKVNAKWDVQKQELEVNCIPEELSFRWSWQDIKNHLNLLEDIIPYDAVEVRDRDSIALIFRSTVENDYCKSSHQDYDFDEFGILTSEGFILK